MLISKQFCFRFNRLPQHARYLTQIPSPIPPSSREDNYSNNWHKSNNNRTALKYASFLGVGCALTLYLKPKGFADAAAKDPPDETQKYGQRKPGLPEYTSDQVSEHNSKETRVWMSFRNGVYDVTDFIKEHPGGDKIMLGAGGSVEPFWALFAVHKNPHVLEMFEKYRIGNLAKRDVGADTKNMSDPYAQEPERHVILRPVSKQPFNAEPVPSILMESLHTPNDFFYVRNHLPVPEVDGETYELDLEGLGIKDKTISLKDIRKFPKRTITAAIQCGGNRRSEMSQVKPVKGLSWGQAAISNAEWSGARLCDVLEAAGLKKDTKALHVQFEGFDLDPTGNPYGASIPIDKALDPLGDVLLAYEMNGEPLSRDHGFPIRVVVPGVVGARHVKWLGRIIVSEEESPSHWQQNDYKSFSPSVDWDTVDFTKSPAIQDLPVTSAICFPEDGAVVAKDEDGKVSIGGYAYSGGGRKIIRVDISLDGGKKWMEVDELNTDDAKHPHAWGWTLWKTRLHVPRGDVEVVVKAVDSNYNCQPEKFADIWNLRGMLSNAYHRIRVKVKN